jgi:heme/copper-type cytochrome/quinol oxidase subunit 2
VVAAVSLALGSHSGSGGNERAETARVLSWPFGQWIVAAVGVALLVYGVVNIVRAKTRSFRDDLSEHGMHGGVRTWAVRSGVLGHAARGVVFVMVGFFLTKAAIEYDPDEAIGIDGALAKLAHQTYGIWLLAVVALGLLAYAVFCVVQARYRRV